MHSHVCNTQGEKAALKAKADADTEIQTRACISIPLVDEKQEDVERAQSTRFVAGSSLDERKRKRREIKSQSVFGDSYSPKTKASRQLTVKTGVRLDSSVFGKGKRGRAEGSTSSALSVRDHRQSLGIVRPNTSTRSSSSSS